MTLAESLRNNRWIPHKPTLKQAEFLLLPDDEALYGGAAGGGKSDALLMGALQFADVPGYSAGLFRRSYADLIKPDSLMDRAHKWLANTGARWNGMNHQWRFPSGAVLSFGYIARFDDVFKHDSAQYQYVGFDETTQFDEREWEFMHGRMRRLVEYRFIPIRLRGATNPGGRGHQWCYRRFAIDGKPGYPFVPAVLEDNPYVDIEDYHRQLTYLDPILFSQRRKGAWVLDSSKSQFKLEWWDGRNRFNLDDGKWSNSCVARFQSWDTAMEDGEENCLSCCCTFEMDSEYRTALVDVWADHVKGVDVPDLIARKAKEARRDGKLKAVVIENASSGQVAIQALRRRNDWLAKLVVSFDPAKFGDKLVQRPQRAAIWCGRDCVLLPYPSSKCPWLWQLEDDMQWWPDIEFMDRVDAFVQGIIYQENYLQKGWLARGGPSLQNE